MYKKIFLIISFLGLSFGTVELSFGGYDYSSNSIPVYYNSSDDIYGFQFVSNQNSDVLSLASVSGGIAEELGFSVSSSSNTGVVLGFSFSGASLPAGSHLLTNLYFTVVDGGSITEICLSEAIFSGFQGASLSVDEGLCATYTPQPIELSLGEYDHSNNIINLYASSPYDIAGFQFQAESASLILEGASGGAAEDVGFQVSSSSDTGVVLGFSLTGSSIPAGDNILLVTLAFDIDSFEESEICLNNIIFSGNGGSSLYTTGPNCAIYVPQPVELSFDEYNGSENTINLYASSPYDIYGYQFNAESVSLTLADVYGGAAEDAGFAISTDNNTSVGFSLTGSYIPAGENILLATLAFDVEVFEESEICLGGLILSGAGGSSLYTTGPDCATYTPPPIEVSLGEELINGMVQVILNSPYDVYGFQFDVIADNVSLVSASGGAAEDAGFSVSVGADTVLGFSFSGASIENGDYALTSLLFDGTGNALICLDGIILSGPGGSDLPFIDLGCREFNFNEVEVSIISPTDGELLSGTDIMVSVEGVGLSEGDHFHAYLDGEMQGMFYEDTFYIEPSYSGYQILEVRVANSNHEEYESDSASDQIDIGFAFSGDYNLDGQVNILDLVATTQYVLFGTESDPLQLVGSDYNADGSVNILDLVATTQFILFGN